MSTSEHVYVLTPKGDQLAIAFDPADTLENLKAKIEAADGTPAAEQHLAFGGNILEDGHALSEYNVTKEATLFLGVGVEGGAFWTPLFLGMGAAQMGSSFCTTF